MLQKLAQTSLKNTSISEDVDLIIKIEGGDQAFHFHRDELSQRWEIENLELNGAWCVIGPLKTKTRTS